MNPANRAEYRVFQPSAPAAPFPFWFFSREEIKKMNGWQEADGGKNTKC